LYYDLYKNINYIPILTIISFFSLFVANILYIIALKNNANINIMAIIIALAPIITIILSYIILNHPFSSKSIFAFFIIFIGLIIILNEK